MRCLFFIFPFFFIVSPVFSEQVVRLTYGEFPPYLSNKLKHNGVAARIVTEAFALEGVQVEFGHFPWKRAYENARLGEWDGSAVWWRAPERDLDFYFSDPVMASKVVFFHLKNFKFKWTAMEQLRSVNIGATIGYNYGKEFEKYERAGKIRVSRVASDKQNFKKLLANRIEVFPQELDVGYDLLSKNYDLQTVGLFTTHPKPVREDPLYLLLTKRFAKNQKLILKFNRGLKRLNLTGKVQQYIKESRSGAYNQN